MLDIWSLYDFVDRITQKLMGPATGQQARLENVIPCHLPPITMHDHLVLICGLKI